LKVFSWQFIVNGEEEHHLIPDPLPINCGKATLSKTSDMETFEETSIWKSIDEFKKKEYDLLLTDEEKQEYFCGWTLICYDNVEALSATATEVSPETPQIPTAPLN
jgi:hypothetical protein